MNSIYRESENVSTAQNMITNYENKRKWKVIFFF